MPKIKKTYRFDSKIVTCLEKMTPENSSMTFSIEVLILKEAFKKLTKEELIEIFGDEYYNLVYKDLTSK